MASSIIHELHERVRLNSHIVEAANALLVRRPAGGDVEVICQAETTRGFKLVIRNRESGETIRKANVVSVWEVTSEIIRL